MTQSVTIREVNQHTSAVMERVRGGEELVVTRAGQPVARMVPYRPMSRYEQLLAEGRLIPAEAPGGFHPSEPLPKWTPAVEAALEAERAERDFFS
jgi:prevent-host-death family protein